MHEELIYYIWKFQRFNKNLHTVDNKAVEVKHPGWQNNDSGPDFVDARIRIGDTLWAGNVEIHVKSSDWNLHKHQNDNGYNNVILHVVFEYNQKIYDKFGNEIPCVEIKNFIDNQIIHRYNYFIQNKNIIPCEKHISQVDAFCRFSWFEKLAIERLQKKSEEIFLKLNLSKNNWEQSFYETLARNFGFKINAFAFEMLAKSLPLNIFAKHKSNLFQIEALLFGQAGLLDHDFTEDYPKKLKTEYQYLKQKFQLTPIDSHLWKFMRTRPSNFPTLRISQFASLIYKSNALFSKTIEIQNFEDLYDLFTVESSEYWNTHYAFEQNSKNAVKKLGKNSIHLILINTVIPFMFSYGKYKSDEKLCERALDFLNKIPAEENYITRIFAQCTLKAENAMQSQAMIQLYKNYCIPKKCLHCQIGDAIISRKE